MGIGLNSLEYGVLYLGSHYNTGPYIIFPPFGNSNLGKLPYEKDTRFKRLGLKRTWESRKVIPSEMFGSMWWFRGKYLNVEDYTRTNSRQTSLKA